MRNKKKEKVRTGGRKVRRKEERLKKVKKERKKGKAINIQKQ